MGRDCNVEDFAVIAQEVKNYIILVNEVMHELTFINISVIRIMKLFNNQTGST